MPAGELDWLNDRVLAEQRNAPSGSASADAQRELAARKQALA
jgi:hypothetical protein